MGLFDPPSVSIARRVPMSAQSSLAVVQQFAELHVSPSVGHTQRTNIIGMVISAWVMTHARSGTFDMIPRDFQAVEQTYRACERTLASNSVMAIATIDKLFDAGLMPDDATHALAQMVQAARARVSQIDHPSPPVRTAREEVDQIDHLPPPMRTMTDEELLSRRAALDRDLDRITRKR